MADGCPVCQRAVLHGCGGMHDCLWPPAEHVQVVLCCHVNVLRQPGCDDMPDSLQRGCQAAQHCQLPTLELHGLAGGQIESPTSETVSQVATLTVAILAVGGSAVAGTAFFLYKEVSRCIWTGVLHPRRCCARHRCDVSCRAL